MDYTLAKELKDAGFPQEAGDGNWICECDLLRGAPNAVDVLGTGHDKAYQPTLDELIEELAGDFYTLERKSPTSWEAHHRVYNDYMTGSTPAEAVARLWLALNKK